MAYVGESRCQWKKSIGTNDKKVAQRIDDELKDAAQGRRSTDEIKHFLASIKTDQRAQRVARKAFDDVLNSVSGQGLGSRTTWGYIDEWLERNKGTLAATTQAKYQRPAQCFHAALGGKADQDMAALRVEDVASFRNSESKRVSKSSANHALRIVRVFFADAERAGVVSKNVARLVRVVSDKQAEKVRRRAFTLPELSRILSKSDDEWKSMVSLLSTPVLGRRTPRGTRRKKLPPSVIAAAARHWFVTPLTQAFHGAALVSFPTVRNLSRRPVTLGARDTFGSINQILSHNEVPDSVSCNRRIARCGSQRFRRRVRHRTHAHWHLHHRRLR